MISIDNIFITNLLKNKYYQIWIEVKTKIS